MKGWKPSLFSGLGVVSPKRTMINNCTFRKLPIMATLRGVIGDFYAGSRLFEELA